MFHRIYESTVFGMHSASLYLRCSHADHLRDDGEGQVRAKAHLLAAIIGAERGAAACCGWRGARDSAVRDADERLAESLPDAETRVADAETRGGQDGRAEGHKEGLA